MHRNRECLLCQFLGEHGVNHPRVTGMDWGGIDTVKRKGSVWEVLTLPEEQVHRGQVLLRVLDCGAALVTAVVSEDVYNRLQVGSPARFQPRDSREGLPGRITRLTGPSASPANLAIQPSASMRESYHVTVAVPKLAEGHGCMVGRPGRVFFNDGPLEAMAALAPAAP